MSLYKSKGEKTGFYVRILAQNKVDISLAKGRTFCPCIQRQANQPTNLAAVICHKRL